MNTSSLRRSKLEFWGSARSSCLAKLCANISMACHTSGTVLIARPCTRSCVFRPTRTLLSCAWPTGCAIWNSLQLALRTAIGWRWSGPSISSVSQSCALAMTHSVPTPRLLPYFPMEDSVRCWLPESLRVMGKPSLLAASSRSPLSSGVGGSVYLCAGAIFMTTGHCAATCVASSSSGSIPHASIRIGIARGTSGNIYWKPRSRSKAHLCRAVSTANGAGMGARDLGDRVTKPAGDQSARRLPGAAGESEKDLSSFRPILPRS